jgi:DNA-binding transcriptional ArsR family regulator
MDNHSLPSIANDRFAYAKKEAQSLQSFAKKRVPNEKEMVFIDTLRNIKDGRICKQEQFDPTLSNQWRELAEGLLEAMQVSGIDGFWRAYTAIAHDSVKLKEWRPLLDIPAPLPPKEENLPQPPAGILLSEVPDEKVYWLWQRRLPLGKMTTLDGDPGLGKSNLALDIAARVSTGRAMPDGTPGIPGGAGVVLIAPEDGLADTIRPRLRRASANLERIVSLGSIPTTDLGTGYTYDRPFLLPDDLPTLERAIERVQAKLIIIDPLMAIFGNRDTYKDSEVRMILAPLQMLIEKADATCLVIRHLTKGGGSNALYRAGGSIAFIATARSSLMVLKDPVDETKRVLAHVKSNLSIQAANLSFSIASDEAYGDDRPYICWLGQSSQTLQELLNPSAPTAIQSLGAARQEILSVLQEHYPKAVSAKDLAEALPEINSPTLRMTLKRMAEDGQIEKTGRGEYRAFSASSLGNV